LVYVFSAYLEYVAPRKIWQPCLEDVDGVKDDGETSASLLQRERHHEQQERLVCARLQHLRRQPRQTGLGVDFIKLYFGQKVLGQNLILKRTS
jgi:hypothetical protein